MIKSLAFCLEALISEYYEYNSAIIGPLAHPVERIHGMDEASGSSPLGSTTEIYLDLFTAYYIVF